MEVLSGVRVEGAGGEGQRPVEWTGHCMGCGHPPWGTPLSPASLLSLLLPPSRTSPLFHPFSLSLSHLLLVLLTSLSFPYTTLHSTSHFLVFSYHYSLPHRCFSPSQQLALLPLPLFFLLNLSSPHYSRLSLTLSFSPHHYSR